MDKFYWLVVACCLIRATNGLDNRVFPEDFIIGTATSAYQIEGGWIDDGKGLNVWDYITHTFPEYIADGSNGDIACDSYHKYLEDVRILKELGVNFYRFSLNWARILPSGLEYDINQSGIDYYNNLINALLENDIEPMITIFHWDTPVNLYKMGSFTNPTMVKYFTNFARVAFDNFGDRVKYWITFNEPKQQCLKGGDYDVSQLTSDTAGVEVYLCSSTILKSHASVYHLYDDEYRSRFGGSVGIVIDTDWFKPASDSALDQEAAERRLQFTFGWWAHPIFTESGNYPQVMIDRIDARSAEEGFSKSRLPVFTETEINYIKGTADFLGLNQYTTSSCTYQEDDAIDTAPSWFKDHSVVTERHFDFKAETTDGQMVGPSGFKSLLNWIKDTYNNPPIIITENGIGDAGGTEDTDRLLYYQEYMSVVLEAIYDEQINIIGYSAWSLMDNFEWFSGYTVKFGLYSVDFNDDERPRSPKLSARYFANVTSTRCLLTEGTCVSG